MAWTEHQHRLLRGIGLRVWSAPLPSAPAAGGETDVDVDDADEAASTQRPAAPPAALAAPHAAPLAARTPGTIGAPRDARRAAIAALDWPALRATAESCTACGLAATRTRVAFGVGSTQARWLVVGEAPGESEDLAGEPFVGAAGQLLDKMLAALALSRAADAAPGHAVYIANTLKCRPPRNRNPLPDEMACCAPFLERQIALLRPQVILAMGRYALQSLLGSDEPVGRLRGRVHRMHGVPLVVTYHPAYLLRNPVDKARAWEDLCLAADVADSAVRG